VKTKYKQRRRAVLVLGGFFLALMLGVSSDLYAENRTADRPAIEPKEEKIKRDQQPMESDTTGDNISLVGPSAEEIHDFLYPTREDDKVLTRAN
jgi:hypothetical protein